MADEKISKPDDRFLDYARPRRVRRLPIVLLIAGLYLMVGCIPIPATGLYQPNGKRAPDGKIGSRESAPVSIGRTKIEDALIVLVNQVVDPSDYVSPTTPPWGRPRINAWTASEDGRRFWVVYQVRTWTIVWPLCFAADDQTEHRVLQLDVNEEGTVTKCDVLRKYSPWSGPSGLQHVPFKRSYTLLTAVQRSKLEAAGLVMTAEEERAYDDFLALIKNRQKELARRAATRRAPATTEMIEP